MDDFAGKPGMAAAVILASSTHQELAGPENDKPATVRAGAANACGGNVLDVLYLKPDLTYGCVRANRADGAEKSVVVPDARKMRKLGCGFPAVSVRYRLKGSCFGSGAERYDAMVSLQPAGKKDYLIRQAAGDFRCLCRCPG